MEILVVAAVRDEIKPLLDDEALRDSFSYLLTGPGIPALTYGLTRRLAAGKPGLIINAGTCGSFRDELPPGTVVRVTRDCFADLGAEDVRGFIPVYDLLPGAKPAYLPHETPRGTLPPSSTLVGLPAVSAITVNKVHGKAGSIRRIVARYDPDTESMEGASVFYIARMESVPVIQLRSVSNRVEPRNRESWEMEKAITNLNGVLKKVIAELS